MATTDSGLRYVGKMIESPRSPLRPVAAKILSVLIVDDDDDAREMLAQLLLPWNLSVDTAPNGRAAIEMVAAYEYDVIVVDLLLPDVPGLDLIATFQKSKPGLQTVIFTGCPSTTTEVAAKRMGVFDYLRKPDDLLRLADVVLEAGQLSDRAKAVPEATEGTEMPVIVGRDPAMQIVRRQIKEAASCDMTVLIRGETGTGKDPVARSIHAMSDRNKTGIFCKVNCPSIPEALFESEMFGFEKGAFTGAQKQRLGRFELADAGTIFLDEISLLPLNLQAKLLEVLEYKTFYRVGGARKICVDSRIIAATNRPLENMVDSCEFRADLYYRLGVFVIELPPLRRRLGDIPLLVDHFVARYSDHYGHACPQLSDDLISRLMHYPWPGNVRELESIISRYAVTGDASVVASFLDTRNAPLPELMAAPVPPPQVETLETLENLKRNAIKKALVETGWNQRQAAKLLGLSYSAFRRRLEKFGIQRPAFFKDYE